MRCFSSTSSNIQNSLVLELFDLHSQKTFFFLYVPTDNFKNTSGSLDGTFQITWQRKVISSKNIVRIYWPGALCTWEKNRMFLGW